MSVLSSNRHMHPAVATAIGDALRAFWSVVIFSGVVNVLMLAGPLYMLQVYDRVLGARSVPTLVVLTIFLLMAYGFQGLLDVIRTRIVLRAAMLLDGELSSPVHQAVIAIANQSRSANDAHQPVRDLDQIRTFFSSSGPLAIVDLPWVPLFLLLCFLLHVWLGVLAVVGGLILLSLALLTELSNRHSMQVFSRHSGERMAVVEASRRNSETIAAMGLGSIAARRWSLMNSRYLSAMANSGDISGTYAAMSRVTRMLIQSAILGLGAYLVIRNELTPGAMMAASIMVGRALAPIETAIGNWRGFLGARQAISRLSGLLAKMGGRAQFTSLPRPKRSFEIEALSVIPPGAQKPVIQGVQFSLVAGEALGIVGPSGAGKTTLVRALLGIWPVAAGAVRFDGAALHQWDPEQLGQSIGYLSQAVELFDGTVAENIARMSAEPDADLLLKAAQAAGAHELIIRLPQGYDTTIGEAGNILSAGQRQRIALARALYGDPFLLVLDEPNSNLDNDGELALQQAIMSAKARGAIVLLIAHRPASVAACDKLLVIANGVQKLFGPRDDVLRKLSPQAPVSAVKAGLDPVRGVGG